MTAAVAIVQDAFTFIVADTRRWDCGWDRPLPPVGKIWANQDMLLIKAGAGSVADPFMNYVFEHMLGKSFDCESLKRVADSIDPKVQEAHRIACHKNHRVYKPVNYDLIAVSTLKGRGKGASYVRGTNTSLLRYPYGIIATGTNKAAIASHAVNVVEAVLENDADAIDISRVAHEIISRCVTTEPNYIGFPVDCAILRTDAPGKFAVQRTLDTGERVDSSSTGNPENFIVLATSIVKERS